MKGDTMAKSFRVTGLFKSREPGASGKHYYSGKTTEAFTIPAGSTFYVNHHGEDGNKPPLSLTYQPPEDAPDYSVPVESEADIPF
jgi:hypothetical protein